MHTFIRASARLLLFVSTLCCLAAQETVHPPQLQLQHHIIIGLGMGAADALASTPFLYFKNRLQLIQKARTAYLPAPNISINPLHWFRGTAPNCAGLIAVAQVQNVIFEQIKKQTSWGNSNSTATSANSGNLVSPVTSNWLAAPVSGGISALVANPADIILRHVQNQTDKTSAIKTIRNLLELHGWRCFMRGLPVTVARDTGFATGYLAAIPWAKEKIEQNCTNKIVATSAMLGAGCTIGLITTIATHPFDTIAGDLQNDPGKIDADKTGGDACKTAGTNRRAGNSLLSAQKIYQAHGYKGFFSGVVPRAGMVTLSILVLDEAKSTLDTWMRKNIR